MNPDLEKRVPREILEELIEEGTEAFRGILEKLFNVAMRLERSEFLGAEAYERTQSRRGYRNGFKGKRIQTRVGELRLEIPQVRGLSFYPKSLERGCRSEKALKLAIAEMYVMGVSTRKVSEITEQLCGLEISATQVSRVAGMLDEELEGFRSRELGEYPIVYLDAHYEKVRKGGRVQDVAILKALGVNRFGTREVLGLSVRLSEAEVHWREFMAELQKRGLKGVELFVSDDHSGLKAARRAVYPSVPWNRCQFHLKGTKKGDSLLWHLFPSSLHGSEATARSRLQTFDEILRAQGSPSSGVSRNRPTLCCDEERQEQRRGAAYPCVRSLPDIGARVDCPLFEPPADLKKCGILNWRQGGELYRKQGGVPSETDRL